MLLWSHLLRIFINLCTCTTNILSQLVQLDCVAKGAGCSHIDFALSVINPAKHSSHTRHALWMLSKALNLIGVPMLNIKTPFTHPKLLYFAMAVLLHAFHRCSCSGGAYPIYKNCKCMRMVRPPTLISPSFSSVTQQYMSLAPVTLWSTLQSCNYLMNNYRCTSPINIAWSRCVFTECTNVWGRRHLPRWQRPGQKWPSTIKFAHVVTLHSLRCDH